MNRAELIAAVSDRAGLSKVDVDRMLDAFCEVVGKTLKKRDKVMIVGFGTFMVRERRARIGRNPKTGEAVKVKANKMPAFKSGKALKDSIK